MRNFNTTISAQISIAFIRSISFRTFLNASFDSKNIDEQIIASILAARSTSLIRSKDISISTSQANGGLVDKIIAAFSAVKVFGTRKTFYSRHSRVDVRIGV